MDWIKRILNENENYSLNRIFTISILKITSFVLKLSWRKRTLFIFVHCSASKWLCFDVFLSFRLLVYILLPFKLLRRKMSLPKFEFTLQDVIKEKKVSQDEVTEVRLWMPKEHLPEVSDEMIVTFIIACKRDLDSTKRAILAYFRSKKSAPEIFDDRDIDRDDLIVARNTMYHASMPVMTDDDCVVHIFRLNDTRYYKFHYDPIAKLCFMLADISLNRKSPPRGLKVIVDAKGAGLMLLTRFKLKTTKILIEFLQEGLPLNMTEIHVLNTILLVDKLLFMMKPFMKPELYKMLHLHPNNTDMEEFSKNYVPKKCLPSDYGGDLPPFEELNQKTIERYRELKGFFETEEKIRKDWEATLT